LCSLQKCRTSPGTASLRFNKEVIENINPRQRSRRRARVELGEANGRTISQGDENDGLVVFKPIPEEVSNSIRLARLAIELAVAVEERHQVIDVRYCGLPDNRFHAKLLKDWEAGSVAPGGEVGTRKGSRQPAPAPIGRAKIVAGHE
jgi:hypothetical protein